LKRALLDAVNSRSTAVPKFAIAQHKACAALGEVRTGFAAA
jgi:hypothetical protein